MKDWRIFVSDTFVKWFKQIGVLGWVRFRILRIAYKIFWQESPRNGEWDFVLSWLQPLRKWQNVSVVDVGCTESLLIYELIHRKYDTTGLDQRPYQEVRFFPFYIHDITKQCMSAPFDYVVAISSIEHIGLGAYGDDAKKDGDRKAMKNLAAILKPHGQLIITVPNAHLGTDTGRGYSYQAFKKLIKDLFFIIHYEERSNQICAVLGKI